MNYRQKYRKGLNALYLPLYDGLCGILPAHWQPYCGERSFLAQSALYAQGRVAPGDILTWAQAGESPHNYGCASDWALFEGKNFVWPSYKDLRWKEYAAAVEKVGAVWGADWDMDGDVQEHHDKIDCPHNELGLKIPWKRVKIVYDASGLEMAQQFIADNRR